MPLSKPSAFIEAVRAAVLAIPEGSTRSYAQVALMANRPGAMRAVVRALHALKGIPWWRVHRSDGTLAEEVARAQARRLKREGVELFRVGRSGSKLSVRRSGSSSRRSLARPARAHCEPLPEALLAMRQTDMSGIDQASEAAETGP